jgi:hypothetical protein
MSDGIFYVYQYLNEDGAPYYIGKGKNKRMHHDHKKVEVPPIDRRVIIQSGMDEKSAYELEYSLIRLYGRKIDGGILDNVKMSRWACMSGWHHSAASAEKIRQGNLGKVRTAEHRKNYSKPKSAEHIEKIRLANIGRPRDDRYIKVAATKSKQKWYTNGSTTIMVEENNVPDGFVPGRKLKG